MRGRRHLLNDGRGHFDEANLGELPPVLLPIQTASQLKVRRWPGIVPLACSLVFVAQCLWFIQTQSLTYDEPVHILSGLDAWRHHRFDQWNDQPPLARLLLAAPLLPDVGRWRLERRVPPFGTNYWTVSVRPGPEQLAWRTRPVSVVLGVILLWLVWTTARRMWGNPSAHMAAALFALSPPLIAHFSLATVDGAVTLFFFASAVAVIRWRRHPSWSRTLVFGAVLGAFVIAKFCALPLAALALGVMLVTRSEGGWLHRAGKIGAAVIVSAAVVWTAYFWRIGPVTFRSGSFSDVAAYGHVIVPVQTPINLTLRLPAPDYLPALSIVTQHGLKGNPAFLLGEVSRSGGWRSYFPIVVALKWPVMVLALAGVGLVLAGCAGNLPPDLFVLLMFPAAFFGFASVSRLNLGDRYVLPVYPFLLVLCAGAWRVIERRRGAIAIAGVILALQAADTLRYAPDYLSYFNVFIRPAHSHHLLTDSNLDWGQGLLALRRYARAHPSERIRLAYFGGADPRDYGLAVEPLGEDERATGTIVVSATHLSGQFLRDPRAYKWVLKYPEVAVLNHSLHVFKVPAATDGRQ